MRPVNSMLEDVSFSGQKVYVDNPDVAVYHLSCLLHQRKQCFGENKGTDVTIVDDIRE